MRDTLAPLVSRPHVVLGSCVSILGCPDQPLHRLDVVFWDAGAIGVRLRYFCLGIHITLDGRLKEPLEGFGMVLRNAILSLFIQESDVEPGTRMTLIGSFGIPIHRRLVVSFYLSTILESIPKSYLGLDISLVGTGHSLHETHVGSSFIVLRVQHILGGGFGLVASLGRCVATVVFMFVKDYLRPSSMTFGCWDIHVIVVL